MNSDATLLLGRFVEAALRIHGHFQQNSFHTAPQLVLHARVTAPTFKAALIDPEPMESIEEITGRMRVESLAILSKGTNGLA